MPVFRFYGCNQISSAIVIYVVVRNVKTFQFTDVSYCGIADFLKLMGNSARNRVHSRRCDFIRSQRQGFQMILLRHSFADSCAFLIRERAHVEVQRRERHWKPSCQGSAEHPRMVTDVRSICAGTDSDVVLGEVQLFKESLPRDGEEQSYGAFGLDLAIAHIQFD